MPLGLTPAPEQTTEALLDDLTALCGELRAGMPWTGTVAGAIITRLKSALAAAPQEQATEDLRDDLTALCGELRAGMPWTGTVAEAIIVRLESALALMATSAPDNF